MSFNIAGSWRLVAWRRIEGDRVSYPLGKNATGILIYAADGTMALHMVADQRRHIQTTDPLGGDVNQRAEAYSTCLAYHGAWIVDGDRVIHEVVASSFPDWSSTLQIRPFSYDHPELILRTPPAAGAKGTVVNEMVWVRWFATS